MACREFMGDANAEQAGPLACDQEARWVCGLDRGHCFRTVRA